MTFLRIAAAAALCCALAAPVSADPLEGLWASRMHWDAGPSGELVLSRKGNHWHADLGKEHADFASRGSQLQFTFPGGRGSFRGTIRKDAIDGFWIQPHGSDGDPRDPDGKGQTYASPVVLARGEGGAWHGAVAPLQDTFTLYLKIFRDDKGALAGAFRNPEMNFRANASQFAAARDGNTLTFTDPVKPAHQITATIVAAPDRLLIRFQGFNKDFVLTRATPQQATSFYLRPVTEHYIYRAPEDAHDGWTVAHAADTGMDEEKLAQIVQAFIDIDPAAKRPALIHSLLIAHRGKLVLDEYFAGVDRDTPHDERSAAKTFSSVMLGALMQRGAKISPQTSAYPLLAKMGPFANPDPRKNNITLAQLMTHTSGLACDDNDDNSPGGEENVQSQRKNPDWWKYTLDLPMAHDPGTRYAYCSPAINLVGAALTTVSHTWLPQLFDETVARPLQWGPYYWNLMPNDEGYLGGGVFVRPRDMLKLGQAYLNGGVWNGKRIVSAAWVKDSTATHAVVSPQTTGLSADDFSNFYFPGEDGYAWHITTLHTPGHDYRAYGTSGNGGQMVVVVPELDLVVGFTGGNYGQGLIWNAWRDKLIPESIVPAIRN